MEVIPINEDKYLEAIRLSEYAFQYKVPKEDIEEIMEMLKKQQVIGFLDEKQLVAKLHLLSLQVYLGDDLLKMGGIAGVATYPEYRRNGYVKEMLIHILEQLKKDEFRISMLFPFSVPFYRKFGWELFSNKQTVTMTKSDLMFQREATGTVKRSQEGQVADLAIVYTQYATKLFGMLHRDHDWWRKLVKDQQMAIYYDTMKVAKGYIIYTVQDKKMKVKEFVALGGDARRGLWNFICQHDSMINELEMVLHERDPLLFSLKEPRVKQELTPYFMARIVDVKPFLEEYPFHWKNATKETNILIKVTDEYAPWNNQVFEVKPNTINIIPYPNTEEKLISLSINTLTTLLLGYQKASELKELERISGDELALEQLDQLIPKKVPYFYDFF
ncbi:GNAT family N-acetyltransferase [Halalkalibacter krulwichiae]|uniref:Enhanced intracellular survival protein n=1 Tax=Halalkalibacter krulwichiae TaxID=199441 RepID=A0A1X9MDQ8_9BACI|nr:GNAT family N-acetyltransferase [Halalkalibacter krulwichiae]ARK31568.1 Enhanced intracellular survival protein [Halalkalibacter krulwichiae]